MSFNRKSFLISFNYWVCQILTIVESLVPVLTFTYYPPPNLSIRWLRWFDEKCQLGFKEWKKENKKDSYEI